MNQAEQQAYLAENLADLHMPVDLPWWPPAPGWWLLALLGALAVTASTIFIGRKILVSLRAESAICTPQRKLANCFTQWQTDGDSASYIQAVNHLLREAAVNRSGRATVASLNGQSWVAWMETVTATNFSKGTQILLGNGGYQSNPPSPSRQMQAEISAWLQRYTETTANSTETTANSTKTADNA